MWRGCAAGTARWLLYLGLDLLLFLLVGRRFQEIGIENLLRIYARGEHVVLLSNHRKVLYLVGYLRFVYARKYPAAARNLVLLHSSRKEARLTGEYLKSRVGCAVIQRSSKTASAAFRRMLAQSLCGKDVFLTLEQKETGRAVTKAGSVLLADKSRCSIVPVQCWSRRMIVIPGSWDGMEFPICPSRVYIAFGEPVPVRVPGGPSKGSYTRQLSNALSLLNDALAERERR